MAGLFFCPLCTGKRGYNITSEQREVPDETRGVQATAAASKRVQAGQAGTRLPNNYKDGPQGCRSSHLLRRMYVTVRQYCTNSIYFYVTRPAKKGGRIHSRNKKHYRRFDTPFISTPIDQEKLGSTLRSRALSCRVQSLKMLIAGLYRAPYLHILKISDKVKLTERSSSLETVPAARRVC